MEVTITSEAPGILDETLHDLIDDLKRFDLTEKISLETAESRSTVKNSMPKGDAVTITAILLATVSAGGALTVAVGEKGVLSKLANVLEIIARREVVIKTNGIEIEGNANDIEKILRSLS